MSPIDKLTQMFEKFPGIGPRQARRFVHYLLTRPQGARAELARAIGELGAASAQCAQCYRWFTKDSPLRAKESPLCRLCTDQHRERDTLFVVEKDADIEGTERSGYRGLYFVLGGVVPLAAEDPQKHIRARELLRRIEAEAAPQTSRGEASVKLREVILGLSATTEGDHTRALLFETLRPLSEGLDFKLTSLGRGLSTGSELEYADPDTIASALSSRQ